MSFALYHGPRAILYRCVWVTAIASAVLLAALHVLDVVTPNDFAIGLLLKSIEEFAFGLGLLASLLFLLLLLSRSVPGSIKLRAFASAVLPYAVVAILWLMANHARR